MTSYNVIIQNMPELFVEGDVITTGIFAHFSICICTKDITYFVFNTAVSANIGSRGVGWITNALLG